MRVYNSDQLEHGRRPCRSGQYLGTGDFVEATFENWESEFLQMGMYVVLTASCSSAAPRNPSRSTSRRRRTRTPASQRDEPDVPWPVRRGGWVLELYENSLAICFFVLFLRRPAALHAAGGAKAYSEEELPRRRGGRHAGSTSAPSQFWFESFQNWQSEFLAVAAIVGASVYLRQRGSPESKPVAEPHKETGT